MTIREAIVRLLDGASLAEGEMAEVIGQVMDGETTPAQIGAFLALVRRKVETVDEIAGAARAMRERVTPLEAGNGEDLVDTCGTGGDGAHTFNISTAAAIVAAAAGCRVAKHGNRAVSGAVGGADVLEALGVRIDVPIEAVERSLRETGFGFLYAPLLHSAMRHAAGPRRELGVRTIFNLLGPLTNPAGARRQLLGVFDARWVEPLALVLRRLGSMTALVVHGEDGLDEITLTGPTRFAELADGEVRTGTLKPEDFGLRRCRLEELRAETPQDSADRIRAVLAGEPGPARDVVLLNAGAAVHVAGRAATIAAGMERAREAIDRGAAAALLRRIAAVTVEDVAS